MPDKSVSANSVQNHPRLSVYLITYNEECNLGRAFKSISWADEIIVLDSGSTDSTLSIAKKFGAKTEFQKFKSFVDQKNRALDICTGDWLLNIDADEEVSPELRKSIESCISSKGDRGHPVYELTRKTQYLGRWIEHCGWYPEYRARLSRKNNARWVGELVHERLEGSGKVGRLDGDLLHRPYKSLSDHIIKIERYSSLFAEREFNNGRIAGISDILFRPVVRFMNMYIFKAGFLDGIPGLVASIMGGWYVFMKYSRLYEMSRNNA